ncbi:dnaJ homolog subfamily C member 18-like [Symsagittifera roscoffensis]|uniref:dnaJ homolog subfamily C member 18-like n=1 Tax=Symsagittifera roscoffensis TaxID=84072 RepID=UPI00307B5E6A
MSAEALNFYQLLELQRDCSVDDIRRSYRRLALKLHPDKNPDGERKTCESNFQKINEAFMTLNDPEKRSEYDLYLDNESNYNLVRDNVGSETTFRNFSCPEGFERQFFTRDFPEMYFCNFNSETNSGNKRSGNSSRYKYSHTGWQNWDANQNRKRKKFRGFDYGAIPKRDEAFWRQHMKRNKVASHHDDPMSYVAYITPLIVIVLLLIVNALIESKSLFSFNSDYYYTELRHTKGKNVAYYVHEHFADKFEGSVKEFENHVEFTFKNYLHSLCEEESEYKMKNINKAKYFKNEELLYEMEQLKLPHCKLFDQFVAT